MALGLPDDKNEDALRETNFWRIIFGIPIVVSIISILGMLFYVQYDSPKFLINTKKYNSAQKMIKKIY